MRTLNSPIAIIFLIAMASFFGIREVSADQPLTTMTYNIRYLNDSDGDDIWPNRREAVIETISQAEIVGLQEVVDQQLRDVRAGTPGWTWYGVGRDDGKTGGESAPIGFRNDRFDLIDRGTRWLSETPEVAGSRGWDAALPRTFTWVRLRDKPSDREWLVINTHFDHRGAEARRQSGAAIAKFVDQAPEMPIIVMGDLNARPNSPPLQQVLAGEEVTLIDAREQSKYPAVGPTGTWNGFREIDQENRIDHILVNDQIQVLNYTVLDPKTAAGRFASDHLPVVVSLEYSGEKDLK